MYLGYSHDSPTTERLQSKLISLFSTNWLWCVWENQLLPWHRAGTVLDLPNSLGIHFEITN
jgi:hypothetical protein